MFYLVNSSKVGQVCTYLKVSRKSFNALTKEYQWLFDTASNCLEMPKTVDKFWLGLAVAFSQINCNKVKFTGFLYFFLGNLSWFWIFHLFVYI